MLSAGQAIVTRGLIFPALLLASIIIYEWSHSCLDSAGAPQAPCWPMRVAVNEGVQHLAEDTAMHFGTLVGSTFFSGFLQAAAASGGKYRHGMLFTKPLFSWEIKFFRKCDFPWKIYFFFQSNLSKSKPKDFLLSLRIYFLSK